LSGPLFDLAKLSAFIKPQSTDMGLGVEPPK
jgi:hypothetical protein